MSRIFTSNVAPHDIARKYRPRLVGIKLQLLNFGFIRIQLTAVRQLPNKTYRAKFVKQKKVEADLIDPILELLRRSGTLSLSRELIGHDYVVIRQHLVKQGV